jgi:hypothetical protein
MTERAPTEFYTTVGITQSSENTATHHLALLLYMLMTKTATTGPPETKLNAPRLSSHYSHPPYNEFMQHF